MANDIYRQWEGSIVDGFRLDQFLGETERSAVFQTDSSHGKAIIKLIRDDGSDLLTSWSAAAQLDHPNLIRILASGRSEVRGTPVAYIVTEYADETMADVLAQRFLTPTEARDVLATTLGALGYLHSQGFAHGHMRPSNFLAVGDNLKLSIDGVSSPGDPAEDVRMLGAVFQSALAQPLPQPFLDITQHALDPNPDSRWTVSEIATRLDGRMPVRSSTPERRSAWRYIAPLVLILLVATAYLIARLPRRAEQAPQPTAPIAQTTPPPAQPPASAPAPQVEPAPAPPQLAPASRKARTRAERRAKTESVSSRTADQPMPDVPAQAMRTIHGKVTIPIRVEVDASGKVTEARLDSQTGSRYFAGFALKAARQWKFTPSGAPQTWVLRFQFTRDNTQVFPARVNP